MAPIKPVALLFVQQRALQGHATLWCKRYRGRFDEASRLRAEIRERELDVADLQLALSLAVRACEASRRSCEWLRRVALEARAGRDDRPLCNRPGCSRQVGGGVELAETVALAKVSTAHAPALDALVRRMRRRAELELGGACYPCAVAEADGQAR